jgi:hypothetical protein
MGRMSEQSHLTDVQVAIEERLGSIHLGDELAAEGVTTVALDETGQMVERRPDGSTRVLR